MLYKNLPRAVGLRRITLHKSVSNDQEVVYLLLVECTHFMDHIGEAANLLPILRARICGYTGIFRVADSFWQDDRPQPGVSGSGGPKVKPEPEPEVQAASTGEATTPTSGATGFFASLFKSSWSKNNCLWSKKISHKCENKKLHKWTCPTHQILDLFVAVNA
jgi:hypothetical protein